MSPDRLIGTIFIVLSYQIGHCVSQRYAGMYDTDFDLSSSILSDDPSGDVKKAFQQFEGAAQRSSTLKEHFWREFKSMTNFDAANRTLHRFIISRVKFLHLSSSLAYDESDDSISYADIDERLTEWRDRVHMYLQKKVEALKNLVRVAEMVVANFTFSLDPEKVNLEDCDLTYVDVREDTNDTDFIENTNAIHIPIGVINCSAIVQRDIIWLGHDTLVKVFEDNLDRDPTILRQYIAATDSAVTRLHPVVPWKLYPSDLTVDLFDPRSRHWFIKAIACPKDIMFLIDLSGSVAGQTRHLMKLTIMTILATLTPDDYINAIWYNKEVGLVMSTCFDGFIPATTRNKLLIQRCLEVLNETHEADFEKALNFTFDEFAKWDNMTRLKSDLHYGSGCHKCLFVLTDTVQETGQELFDKYGYMNGTLDIRLFGFAMGFNTPDIEALQLLSCRRNGGFFKVDSLEDIKEQSRAYLSVLSRPLAMSMHERTFDSRTVSWTGPYMDAQAEGPVVTLSMPILNKTKGAPTDRFVGVAAIDVKMSRLIELADPALTGPDSYLFAVDNNGNVLFHPDLRIPEIDLQMVRRSACFEATPAKRRSEADKVIFWDTTQNVKMQMGLMDSMFTIDLSELERSTPQLLQLRQSMVSGTCEDGEEFISERLQKFNQKLSRTTAYSYRCRKLTGTPYSFGHAIKRHPRSPSTTARSTLILQKKNFTNNSVAWIPSPRIFCKADLSTVRVTERWSKLVTSIYEYDFECDDSGRTMRLLLDYDAVGQWLNNTLWIESDANQSCHAAMEAYKDTFELVFIQTEGGLTAFYPKCASHMPSVFGKDVFHSEYYQSARLRPHELNFVWTSSERSTLTIFAPIYDQEHQYTPAVIGVQVPINRLWNLWKSAGNRSALGSGFTCWSDHSQRACYLITREFIVIGATNPPVIPPQLHFGTVEPYLFDYIVNKSSEKIVYTEYQDRCRPGEVHSFGSTSDARSTRLLSIIDLVYGTLSGFYGVWSSSFWFNLWSMLSSPLPLPIDGRLVGCETKRPKNDEQCMKQYEIYVFEPNGTSQPDSYYDEGCGTRLYFQWTKIEGTNLYLIEVHRPPRECHRRAKSIYPVQPVPRTQCEEIKEHDQPLPRRRYRSDCIEFHDMESRGYNENTCAGVRHTIALPVIVICSVLAYFRVHDIFNIVG